MHMRNMLSCPVDDVLLPGGRLREQARRRRTAPDADQAVRSGAVLAEAAAPERRRQMPALGQNGDDEAAGPQAGLLAKRMIYFDFDSSEIKGEGTDIVAAHAKYLANNASRARAARGQYRRARLARVQHRPGRAPRAGRAARAAAAGRYRDAALDRELWRGASRGRRA